MIALDPAALAAMGDGPVVIALSGGGDSIALLHLVRESIPNPLIAVIVDHGVRAGSEREAETAARAAREAGADARITRLCWPEKGVRSQAVLRRRRYQALCEIAREESATVIVAGHTADDQAETVLMRAARLKDTQLDWRALRGIAPVAPAPVWPEGRGLALVRPLLCVRRAALRDFLRRRKLRWSEDPSNDNVRYERVRVRQQLAAMEAAGFDAMRLVRLGAQLRELAQVMDRAALRWLSDAEFFQGEAYLDAAKFEAGALSVRGLQALIAAVSGRVQEPDWVRVEALGAAARRPQFKGATLGGARIRRAHGRILLARDIGDLLGRAGVKRRPALGLPVGREEVWDGRVAVRAREPDWYIDGALEPPTWGAPVVWGPGDRQVSLEHAESEGILSFTWLFRARLRHLLAPTGAAFTGA